MPPASIPQIVAHIQEYLTENAFVTMEDLGNSIEQYIEDHPEIVGVFTVNGASGNVALDASDIPIETGEDPTVAGAISYLSSQLALLVADAVLSVNGVTPDDSHNVTLTGADINQDGSTTKKLSETFGPASASAAGTKGLVPAPAAGDENKVLSGSGAWVNQPTGAVQKVCNVGPNAQGNVPLLGSNIPLQSMSLQTVSQAIAEVNGKTGSDIHTSTTDNTPIATTLSNLNDHIVNLNNRARLTDFDLTKLQAAVADQNLEKYGLKPGDQKTINGHTYVIAGLNCMKGTHSYTCTSNHCGLIVIPHTTHAWNASGNTYTGANNRGAGYLNCDLHDYLKNTILPMCNTDLGSGHLYAHKKLLTNSVNTTGYNRFGTNSGCANNWTWTTNDEYICALSKMQVYGGNCWSSSG
jgi:hypothetical protein